MSDREHSDGSPADLQEAPGPGGRRAPSTRLPLPGSRERDSDPALTARVQRPDTSTGAPRRGVVPAGDPRDALPRVLEAMDRSTSYTKPSPLPLPPSPAPVTGVKPWLAPGDLNAGAVPDLGAMAGESSSYTLPPVPELPDMMDEDEDEEDEDGEPLRPRLPAARPPPSWLDLHVRPWLFTALLAVTCLAVGMVLGALIFGDSLGDARVDPWRSDPRHAAPLQCPEPAAPQP